ncbi:MAG: bifunctional uroporphyrinogen-III C-methyltransferase/uroporphyrinogen-III synthase [Pseudonocardiales bacterium]|nr:MAG: bifunctional uroporphyrinogen-III C-methyltransferase/uroporphyrinogen-III synthase [Pseudonocardiales bacterium]
MMSARKTTGRIAFIGAGPGDPGLLTRRAAEVLGSAGYVVHDESVPAEVLALIAPGAELSTAEGLPGDVAKLLLSAARSGGTVVRLVGGDPFISDDAVAELKAVARTAVPFEIVPGLPADTAVPAYAGIPVGSSRTVVDITEGEADWSALATAPGTLVLAASAAHLGKISAGLQEHGRSGSTAVAVTAAGATDWQESIDTTLETIESDAGHLQGPLLVMLGAGVALRGRLSWWESRALYGWRVLVPRTREQAGAMSTRLRVHGAVPVEVATIAVEPPRTPAQMERAVKGLVTGRYEWIVFTSTNAVRAVWEKFAEFGLDARAFAGVKIACVGEATADAVRAFGIQPELVPGGEQSSAGLLVDFPPYDDVLDPIDRVFLPRADIATETLAAGLIERGWEVDDVTAYRTVRAAPPAARTRDAIKTGGFDAVLFTSSSTVRNLVGIAGKPHPRTVVACIGPKTAETAREMGLSVDVQPETASVPALVEALAAHVRHLKETDGVAPPSRSAKARSKPKAAK